MFPTVDTEDISPVTSLLTTQSSSSDAQNTAENTQIATQRNHRELTLNMLIKEMVFCIALALTTYGALHNTPTKVSKHPDAARFFKADSIVRDWYRGQLSQVLSQVNQEDIAFVMYYAPWDAESQYVRKEFEQTAMVLKDRVHFAAINCWHPGSECRLQNSKIQSWPILVVYPVISKGIVYKGSRDAHSMVKFLELIMKPLKRVSSSEDLVKLLSYCDVVAVGYTPLTETSKYYNVWHSVALDIREMDPLGEICFAVVTSDELAVDLGVEVVPNARLMLWNDTKEYISLNTDLQVWNNSALIKWMLDNFSQPVARIIPMWKKAFNFERYVDGNPILILFTPLNPLYDQQPSYALLREVAMEYYSCKDNDNNQWTTEIIKLQHVQRLIHQQKNITKFCQEFKFKKPKIKLNPVYKKEVESRNNKYPWNNTTEKTLKTGFFDVLLKQGLPVSKSVQSEERSQLLTSLDWLQVCSMKALPAESSFYEQYDRCHLFDENISFEQTEDVEDELKTTMLPFEDDPRTPENLVQESVKHFCNVMKFATEWGPAVKLAVPSMVENASLVQGLSCAYNFSLHMLAVDSVINYHFAESLGIDITNKKDMTAVVILDSKHESQYVLSEEYNDRTIREFIYNFTTRNLKRSLRSHVHDAAHTHYFGSNGTTDQMGINENSTHIIDLTSRSFRRMIKTPGTLRLVCVCGGGCSAAASRALAAAARLLRACGVPLRVARLDALRHDLPCHYSPPHYPALLAFPPNSSGEAESVSYPNEERITTAGVVALALRSLGAPEHLRVRLALCKAVQGITEKRTCLRDIRSHVTSLLNRNLKYYRQTDNTLLRNALLDRLQSLHTVALHLSLFHITDLSESSSKQMSLLNTFSALSKTWSSVSILNKTIARTS